MTMKIYQAASLLLTTLVATSPVAMVEGKLSRKARTGRNAVQSEQHTKARNGLPGLHDTNKRELKSGKGTEDLGEFCDNCGSRLPGFVWWGYSYLEEDFYERLFDGDIEFGGFCVYLDPAAQFGCLILTALSEIIYNSDTLSCLLTSFSKTTRDTLCFLADEEGVGNPDVLGEPQPFDPVTRRRRSLAEVSKSGDPMVDFVKLVQDAHGRRKLDDEDDELWTLLDLFGVTDETIVEWCAANGGEQYCRDKFDSLGRKLNEDIRPSQEDIGSGGILQFIGELVDDIADPLLGYEIGEFLLTAGWLDKCSEDTDPISCFVILALEKTEDAIICSKEKECNIETDCDANQEFRTEYNARKLARQIPNFSGDDPDGLFNFLVADILAPCTTCETSCASFCWYVDNFDQCDDYKRVWLFTEEEDTGTVGEFYNVILPELWGDILFG